MLAQMKHSLTLVQVPILNTELRQIESNSKEQVIDLIIKLFAYGRHLGISSNTYNKKSSLLVRKGINREVKWIKVELVNVEKLQRNKVETKQVFYAEKSSRQDWFVSYFHSGDWIEELISVVESFESQCFSFI